MPTIIDLQPRLLWKHFAAVCSIPHPSKKESQLARHVFDFGKKLGYETEMDKTGNVLIRKPATPGMENRKTIILQAHLDMVPQKNTDKIFDFDTDPIETIVDGDWLKANGTTLGSDNGIGVAAMMAVLEDSSLKHGALEALFTVDEETGMTGAFQLQPGFLKGDILLNLDTEEESEICVGCAGGVNTTVFLDLEFEKRSENMKSFQLRITGLKGGHSGIDINLGRANANKLMARMLHQLNEALNIRLQQWSGGNMRNAIPREAFAVFCLDKSQEDKLSAIIGQCIDEIRNEFKIADPVIRIDCEPMAGNGEKTLSRDCQQRLISLVNAIPSHATRMIDDIPGVVETSTNLAIVRTNDNVAEIKNLVRSSVNSARKQLALSIESAARLAGATTKHEGDYPGWQPDFSSSILSIMKKIYQERYKQNPHVIVVHAGLECGIIGAVYPGIEMVSFGPTIKHPHSPDEKVLIPSVQRFWDFLVDILANSPKS